MNQEVQDLRVQRRSPVSFWTADSQGIADWLAQRGYSEIPITTMLEYKRLQFGQAIVSIYLSGTVSCQGANAAAAVELLERLVQA